MTRCARHKGLIGPLVLSALLHLLLCFGLPLHLQGGRTRHAGFPRSASRATLALDVRLPEKAPTPASLPLPSLKVPSPRLPPMPLPSALQPETGKPTEKPASTHAARPHPDGTSSTSQLAPRPGLLDVHYYPVAETNPQPQVQELVPLEFKDLGQYPEGGKLILDIWISQFGGVDDVTVESNELPPAFLDHVRQAFLGARFSPGYKDGEVVNCVMRIEVNYAELLRLVPVRPISQNAGEHLPPPR